MEPSAFSDLTLGVVFAGRYRVEQRIAAGGMGAVYEVLHIETNRRRALKVMHAHYVSSDELRARFRQEARVAAEVDSEHIVDVFDAGIDDATGMPFLVMELLRGEDLGKLVKRIGALPKEDVVRYLYETSLALDQTHTARIVHRDLKPDNLFLCERARGPGRIKVLDFGIAKIVKDAQTQANATRSLGTPLYMAPEQFLLQSAVSGSTDIFALGMIAFTLLVGKPYWFQESKMAGEVLAFALHASRGPTESAVTRAWDLYGVELPKAFDAWFFRATARRPGERFATAREAVIALADALGVPSPDEDKASRTPQPKISPAKTPESEIKARRTTSNSPADLATIALPAVSRSSPSGLMPTAPTQIALTQSSHGTASRKSAGAPMLTLLGSAATLFIGLGIWLVVKGFGAPHQGEIREPAARAVSVATPVTSVEVSPPVVASVEVPLVIDSIPSAGPAPEVPPPAQITERLKPAVIAPDVPKTNATIAPRTPAAPPKKPSAPKDGLPDD